MENYSLEVMNAQREADEYARIEVELAREAMCDELDDEFDDEPPFNEEAGWLTHWDQSTLC